MDRGAIAEIDLNAIAQNFRIVQKIVKNRKIIVIVKANAYGHGAPKVASCLVKQGAPYLAVAYTSEAIELRDAGITAPIIVLFDKDEIPLYFEYSLIPAIHDVKTAQIFSKIAKKRRQKINVHIKLDTGMGRLGFNNINGAAEKITTIAKMDSVEITGIMSHFSDADLADRSYALLQLERFNSVRNSILKKGIKPQLFHMANSAAIMSLPESYFDAVRPGIMLYGYSPIQNGSRDQRGNVSRKNKFPESSDPRILESFLMPAMTVKTKILSLRKVKKGMPISYGRTFVTTRDSYIAVLPIGYADGYSRAFSNNSEVLIRNKRAPVVGRVCMDITMADVTDINKVSEGDEVVLLGNQKNNTINAFELAAKISTIPYEILTSFGNNARRVYINEN